MSKRENFLTVKEAGQHTIIIKKSKFITNIARTATIEQAQNFIKHISKKYRDASHNTYAYTLGIDENQVKASDNGEPSGTAGVAELRALQLMKIKNVTAVVTRYFGGIKLGTGGLIRAYSNSITQAIEAIGVVKRVLQQELIFTIAYNKFNQIEHYLKENNILIANINYGVAVKISIFLDDEQSKKVKSDLNNLLAEHVKFIKGKKCYHEIPVHKNNFHEQ